MKLNLKLRLLRHLTGLDQQQIAEKLNIGVADYSKIETDLLKPGDAVFENMIALFRLGREQFNAWPYDKSEDRVKGYLA